jgi:VWFA-related protein
MRPIRLRSTIRAGVLFLLLVPAVMPVGAAQGEARDRHVYVGVTTSRDAPVPNLTPRDFTVREDDRPREIIRVAPAPPPSHIALVVDTSEAATLLIPALRDAASRFVQRMASTDAPPAISVITFGERPTTVSPFTTSLPLTARAVVGLVARPNSGAYLLDAIVEAAGALKKADAAQPVVVAFTIDESTEYSDLRAERVSDALREAGASLWVVQLRSTRGAVSDDQRERERVIEEVSKASGGMNRPILSQSSVETGFEFIASAILSRYDVVYGRPESLVPPSRLRVEVSNRQWRVTAPTWARP